MVRKEAGGAILELDAEGRHWLKGKGGIHQLLNPSEVQRGHDFKRAFVLRQHVEAFIKYWGRDHSLFFTTTDAEGLPPKEYARRWNSLLTHESDWLQGFLRVLEPQRNGRPHFHNLVSVRFDTRPDHFDWESFNTAKEAFREKDWPRFRDMKARYSQSAVSELRELWKWSRRVMPRYGLGRSEILPIRKEGAISEYIGKYLDKGMAVKIDSWKGVRRFETDRRTSKDWKCCSRQFSWVGWKIDKESGEIVPTGAYFWRQRVSQIAFAIGVDSSKCDLKEITAKLGLRWAYRIRGVATTGSESEWKETLLSLGVRQGHIKVRYEWGEIPHYNQWRNPSG